MFTVGQKVFRNYPVTSSVEGVVGYTKLEHTVAGPPFDYRGGDLRSANEEGNGEGPLPGKSLGTVYGGE